MYRLQRGLASAVLFLMSLLMLIPLLLVVNIALKSKEEFLKYPIKLVHSPHWHNFYEVWTQGEMSSYFKNSLIYSFFVALGTCFVAGMAAYPIGRGHFRGTNIIYLLFLSALFLPVSLVPLLYVMKFLELMNTYYGYILLTIGNSLSVSIFIFVAFVKGVPRELDEAAAVDGCGYFRFIFTIVFPLMKPAIATVAMLVAIGTWNDFINPYLFLTDRSMRPLTAGLYLFFGQYSTDWTFLAAGIIVVSVPLFIAYVLLQKYIVSGMTSGAVKA